MSAGSDASNLGYGNIFPFVGKSGLVNPDNSHYAGGFGSNEAPAFGKFGLPGAAYNVNAANSCVPGLCYKGGAKSLKHKIKNISKMYKMKGGKRTLKKRIHHLKRKIASRFSKRSGKRSGKRSKHHGKSKKHHRGRSIRNKRSYRGGSGMPNYPAGYAQYQNNMPMTNTYSLGGPLSAKDLGLANPPPHTPLSNCTNCVDNYNHNTNSGVASRGWW